MIVPKLHMVGYDDRLPGFIFVAIPNQVGRYIRTDRSVALSPCSHCGAVVGEPCLSGNSKSLTISARYSGLTHVMRRKSVKYASKADDVIIPVKPVDDCWEKDIFDSIEIYGESQK